MIRIAAVVLGVALLLIVGLLAAPAFIPKSVLEAQAEKAAAEALGRRVDLSEDLSLSLFPTARIRTGAVTIDNAPGFEEPFLAKIEDAELRVALLPILGRRVEVQAFVLKSPDIRLEIAEDGSANWEFASSAEESASTTPQQGGEPQAPADIDGDLRLGDVRIENGALLFIDRAGGQRREIADLDATVTLESLDRPFAAVARMAVDGTAARIDIETGAPRGFLNKTPTDVKGAVSFGDTMLNGEAVVTTTDDGAEAAGALSFETKSVRDLAAFAGAPVDAPNGFGPASLSGAFKADGKTFTFADAAFAFDEMAGTGAVSIDLSGARPKVTAEASVGDLDLRPYLTAAPVDDAAAESAAGEGFPAWSEEPIDVSALRIADLDLTLKTGAILLDGLSIERSALTATAINGVLVAKLTDLGLYGGAGTGEARIDARNATPAFTIQADVSGFDADAFAREAMKLDRLEGTAALTASFTARGASEAAIVRSLDGSGRFMVTEGAIRGVDVGAAANDALALIDQTNLQNAANLRSAAGAGRRTAFSRLGGAFTSAKGVMALQDVAMAAGRLSIVGAGTVDLPRQRTDIDLTAAYQRVVNGQVGGQRSVPLQIGGTFSEPTFGLDVKRAAKDTAANQIDRLLDKAVGGEANRGQGSTAEAVAGAAASLLFNRKKKKEKEEEEETPPPADDGGGR
ncbi:MAG: AsmA family protein [Pseudomonadota bacterium]